MKHWIFFLGLVFSQAISAQNTITTDSILQLSTCAGGNILVPFQATGTYPIGNVFTAQLSNAFGQFTTPVNIGTVPFNVGLIFATIPASTNFGFLYKIRVVSSNPATVGTPCPNTLIITQVAQLNQIIASPNDSVCIGDTITLTAINPASSYAWSTGDTTMSIQVTQAGTYTVNTIDFLTCESDTSATVVFGPCALDLAENERHPTFDLYPNPAVDQIIVSDVPSYFPNYDVEIVNLLGQTICRHLSVANNGNYVLDISHLEKGMYVVKIQFGTFEIEQKMVVQ